MKHHRHVASPLEAIHCIGLQLRAADTLIDELLSADYYVSEFDRSCLVEELRKHVTWDESVEVVQHLRHITDLDRQHKRVQRYLGGDRREIDARNQHFVESELMTWRDWFARIEKTPSTEEQAKASVIMEDRNLLIAAAGSGKTVRRQKKWNNLQPDLMEAFAHFGVNFLDQIKT